MVMSLIESLTRIKNAVYGREVREAIHDGVFRANQIADGADAKADKTQIRQDAVEDFNTQVIQEMTDKDVVSAPEIIAGRIDRIGSASGLLKDRLDNQQTVVNVKSFGAKGDNVTDDSLAIQSAYNSLQEGDTLFIPHGIFVANNLVFDRMINLHCTGRIRQPENEGGTCVTISGDRINTIGRLEVFRNSVNWSRNTVGIALRSSNESNLSLQYYRFKVGLLLIDEEGKGTAYNNIVLGRLWDNETTVKFSQSLKCVLHNGCAINKRFGQVHDNVI